MTDLSGNTCIIKSLLTFLISSNNLYLESDSNSQNTKMLSSSHANGFIALFVSLPQSVLYCKYTNVKLHASLSSSLTHVIHGAVTDSSEGSELGSVS